VVNCDASTQVPTVGRRSGGKDVSRKILHSRHSRFATCLSSVVLLSLAAIHLFSFSLCCDPSVVRWISDRREQHSKSHRIEVVFTMLKDRTGCHSRAGERRDNMRRLCKSTSDPRMSAAGHQEQLQRLFLDLHPSPSVLVISNHPAAPHHIFRTESARRPKMPFGTPAPCTRTVPLRP
jgi:hypothetical protein